MDSYITHTHIHAKICIIIYLVFVLQMYANTVEHDISIAQVGKYLNKLCDDASVADYFLLNRSQSNTSKRSSLFRESQQTHVSNVYITTSTYLWLHMYVCIVCTIHVSGTWLQGYILVTYYVCKFKYCSII